MSSLPRLSEVEVLAPTHEVGAFACGDDSMDEFLRTRASIEQAQRLSQVHVVTDGTPRVLAFFTLSPVTVRVVPGLLSAIGLKRIPHSNVGAYLLGRLGVDASIAGRGVGAALVIEAARIARDQSQSLGGAFLTVDAKDEKLVVWYRRLGFERLGAAPLRRMVLPWGRIPT